jgi:hypothetical protein
MRSSVLLPAPLWPMMPSTWPRGTAKSMWRSAQVCGRRRTSSRSCLTRLIKRRGALDSTSRSA